MKSFAATLVLATVATAQINYLDFSSTPNLSFVNNAQIVGTTLRVSSAVISDRGAAWEGTPFNVVNGFDMAFRFQITSPNSGGGDGFALVFQNDPRLTLAIGNHASALGYGAFLNAPAGTAIANSLAIEFDTFLGNFNGVPDLSGNEVSIHTGGTGDNSQDENFSIGRVNVPVNMSSGAVLTARVRYVPGTLDVFVGNMTTPVLTVPYDFITGGTHILPGTPVGGLNLIGGTSLLAGFTASAGAAWENHDILSWQSAPFEFEMNKAGASLDINGLADPGPFSPLIFNALAGSTNAVNLDSTNAGAPWDLGLVIPGPAVGTSMLGITTGGGQTVNVNLTSPSFSFLQGGTVPNLTTSAFPSGGLTFMVSFPSTITASAQLIVLDPVQIDGFALSHAVQYVVP